MPQKFLTTAILKKVPPLGATSGMPADKIKVHVKFFGPECRYYMVEYDPVEKLAYGYIKTEDPAKRKLGQFNTDKLQAIKYPLGIKIERDAYFKTCTLAAVMDGTIE
jgi:hypothetical protein